ncbi:unnamed protein product [Mycena citricolor]|uniref:hydroxyisourate hydrolase n=1 Tax=Mycena citricolor TaxID=2018698 RepID=A0AAD2JW55_9AGAR|nr:unnamed protein product [Mycena citricolor]
MGVIGAESAPFAASIIDKGRLRPLFANDHTMSKSPITCHVLDSSLGKPAEGVRVRLMFYGAAAEAMTGATSGMVSLGSGQTNSDGRCIDLLPARDVQTLSAGIYKIVFETKDYFAGTGRKCFYPFVEVLEIHVLPLSMISPTIQITFEVETPEQHYHIPLLISPYSYTTYRGS